MNSDERHRIAWIIMERRWSWSRKRNWDAIAKDVSLTPKQLRELRMSKEYRHLVWAEYGRYPARFNRHRVYEHCIRHLRMFFGIPRQLAVDVLGKDWKEPEVQATQLQIDI